MFFNERQATFANSNFFNVAIENNEIFKVDFWGNSQPQKIGVTLEKYQEVLDVANKFQEKLEELGVLEKEKTPEEIQEEHNKLLCTINNKMDSIFERMDNFSGRLEFLERSNLEKFESLKSEEVEEIDINEQYNSKKDNERINKQIKHKSK